MAELPLHIRKSIAKFEPIEIDGLTLYPVKVEEYYEFLIARQAIEFMQQRLPVELMSEPLLSAFFKIDSDRVEGINPNGLFASALLSIALALRLKPGHSIEERLREFEVVVDSEDQTKLKNIRCVVNGEEMIVITPVLFQRIRPIIAAQNGIVLHDDLDNPELVDAENDLASKSANLDISVEAFVNSTALIAGVEEKDVYDWEILKMHNRLDAAKKVLDYIICGIGESQGTTWKGGNPHPHPWFDRQKEGNAGLMPIESFANGQGLQAIQNATNNSKTLT